jgi:hypothetical protein
MTNYKIGVYLKIQKKYIIFYLGLLGLVVNSRLSRVPITENSVLKRF